MIEILYLISAVCFILAIRGLASADKAVFGNYCGIIGMLIACGTAYVTVEFSDIGFSLIAVFIGAVIGIWIAKTISMTSLPQMIAGFHSLVGLAAVLISFAVYASPELFKIAEGGTIKTFSLIEMGLGIAIGAITFSGSVVAFCKLVGFYKGHRIAVVVNAIMGLVVLGSLFFVLVSPSFTSLTLLAVISFIFGFTLIAPIGGADMPVIVSMLNSYSGWAAAGIGFTMHNDVLIITGALVGSSGAILSYIMCKGMNRSLLNVMFAPIQSAIENNSQQEKVYKQGAPEDAAFLLKNASSVIIVPGYGMATSQSQHALREMGEILKKHGVSVKYAIHPVAGRMPGHMNVLLADANVPYEDVKELDEINRDFSSCDVAFVIGANDVTNPAAEKDPTSPIYGMPILEVSKAKVVLFLKRSMGVGYSGIDNELFYAPNTMMLLGDAKKTTEAIVKAL